MRLFILRHGKAKDGLPDELRELRNRGRNDLNQVLESRLNELGSVAQIQTSALVRAEQTAEIAAAMLGYSAEIKENMHLTPWGKPLEFIKSIDDSAGDLLIASHQPFVSDLVTTLTGSDIWMPTSSLVCVEAEYMSAGCAELVWQQDPIES